MWMEPQLTVIWTWSTWSDPSLVVVTVAELSTVPQVAAVAGEVMWTCLVAPEPKLAKAQVRVPTEMEHPASDPPASMLQDRLALVCTVSETVTFLAALSLHDALPIS